MNARPGPDDSANLSTVSPKDFARNPIVEKTANPANTPVKQSHETTIHICLNYLDKIIIIYDESYAISLEEVIIEFI